MCRVTAPVGSTVAAVLRAAQAEAMPDGCVTAVEAGERVDSLNGVATRPGERGWEVLRNGESATADEAVGLGDMIALAYVANRPAPERPAPPGPRLELSPPPIVQPTPLPRATIASRRLALRGRRVAASLACPRGTGAVGCRGVLSLRAHARAAGTVRRITVARATFAIAAGERRTIALRIPAARRRGLRRLPVRRVILLAATREPATGRIAITRARLALATR
jgi:hypothetical protein